MDYLLSDLDEYIKEVHILVVVMGQFAVVQTLGNSSTI